MKRVIITADDFGLCKEVDRAVVLAHEKGILTCASLMVSGRTAGEAVMMAKRNPSLAVGLHLVLVDGRSVLSRSRIPGLVDNMNRFSGKVVYSGIRSFFSKELQRQIAWEYEAQIKAFLDTGLEMDHLNSHHHLHIHPAISDIVLHLVQKYRIPAVRLPLQARPPLKAKQIMTAAVMSPWVHRLRRRLTRAGIAFNRQLFGLYETGAMVEEAWMNIIPRLREGVTEIYCHPAVGRSSVLRERMPAYRHTEEFNALTGPRVREELDRCHALRTNFSRIAASPLKHQEFPEPVIDQQTNAYIHKKGDGRVYPEIIDHHPHDECSDGHA